MNNQFDDLFKDFKSRKFQKINSKEETFFDVAGFPQYENVASNVLQFFFDTRNDRYHGFDNLWLMALVYAYNKKANEKILEEDYYTVDVKREYAIGKRIDLLIDCDSLVFVIENKIYADLYNDLELYTVMAKNYKNATNGVKGIVLTLSPLKGKDEYLKQANYVNIIYEDLFEYIEKNHQFDQGNKWQLLAKEFIANIRKLRGLKIMKFDTEWFGFVKQNGNQLNTLFELSKNDLDTRINLVKELDSAFVDFPGIVRHGPYTYSQERYVSQFVDIYREENATICIETYLMRAYSDKDYEQFDKVYVALWTRRNKCYDFSKLLEKLNVKNAREITTPGWGKHYILKEFDLNNDLDINELKNTVVDFVKTLL